MTDLAAVTHQMQQLGFTATAEQNGSLFTKNNITIGVSNDGPWKYMRDEPVQLFTHRPYLVNGLDFTSLLKFLEAYI